MSDNVTFLIVDDDEVAVMSIRRAISKLRLTNPVEVVGNGLEALERLRENQRREEQRSYIILLDINMPLMGGLEFLSQVRADDMLRKSVVFVLTTSDAPEDIAAAYHHVVAGYIVKEDAFDTLRKAIEMLRSYVEIVRLPA